MKLKTLKAVESALTGAISAEEAKIKAGRTQLENAFRNALNKPEIGRGKKMPVGIYDRDKLYFDENRLDIGRALCILKKTLTLTKSDTVKAECERLFKLFSGCANKENTAYRRIVELTEALREIREISWRE